MKKEQRKIYRILVNEVGNILCGFCKYAEVSGYCCDDCDIFCNHPLLDKSWNFEKEQENAVQMGDCWGFRPSHPVSFVADIVGIMLQKGWDSASWWQDKEGNWKITGERNKQAVLV